MPCVMLLTKPVFQRRLPAVVTKEHHRRGRVVRCDGVGIHMNMTTMTGRF